MSSMKEWYEAYRRPKRDEVVVKVDIDWFGFWAGVLITLAVVKEWFL